METSLFLDRNVLNYSHTTVFQSHPALFDARGDHYVLGVFVLYFLIFSIFSDTYRMHRWPKYMRLI